MDIVFVRTVLLVLHIFAVGMLLGRIVGDIILDRVRAQMEGKPSEVPVLMAQMRLIATMGQVGGLGVLITGVLLALTQQLGVFNLGGMTPTWLLLKQIIYVIILGTVIVVISPMGRTLIPKFIEAAKANPPQVTPEMRGLVAKIKRINQFTDALVLVAVVLAVWKPV